MNDLFYISPIVISCLLERVTTYFSVYAKLEVIVWKNMRLFTWRDKIWFFSIVTGSIWFDFCFKLNTFTSRISNLLLPFGTEGRGLWILIYLLWISKSSYRRCSIKKVFLKILRNSRESTCVRVSFLTKLQAWGLQLY